jgi:acetyl-CoA acetyltransferase
VTRNPIKDKVAVVGVGSTGFSRNAGRSRMSLGVEAAVSAIRDAGLTASDIDGVCGTNPNAAALVGALGLPEVTYFQNQVPSLGFSIIEAMNAIYSGACETVLVVHSVIRRGVLGDPIRTRSDPGGPLPVSLVPIPQPLLASEARPKMDPETAVATNGYPSWASRYCFEYQPKREYFGYVALNGRNGAVQNPLAAMREPITMDDYLTARWVFEPLCLLDCDLPVDGADAFVLTRTKRARDLPQKPVLIHAATAGIVNRGAEDQLPSLQYHGQHVVARDLREKSDIWLPDIDLYFPYDGFTFITLSWIESVGWCRPGEGGSFLEEHWNHTTGRVLINGKIPMNPHGGSLSEGATQGSGHIREAVTQLRGGAGPRQKAGVTTALLTLGGIFFNAQGLVFRVE